MSGHRREFIGWLVKTCAQDGTKPADIIDGDTSEFDFLAGTLAIDRTREFTELLRVAGVPV